MSLWRLVFVTLTGNSQRSSIAAGKIKMSAPKTIPKDAQVTIFYHRSLLHERFRRIWTSFIYRIRSGDVSICRETAAVWAARLQLASAANNVSIGCLQKHQRNAINLAQVLLDFGYILYYIYINWGTYQQFAAMTFFCLSNEGFYLVNAAQLLLWLQTARVMIPGVCYQSLPCCLLIGGLTAACF